MSHALKDLLVASGDTADGRFHLFAGFTDTPLPATVHLKTNEEFIHPGQRIYTRASLALPAPNGFAYPLVLSIAAPGIARSLARTFEHIADLLTETYPTEDEIGEDTDVEH